MADLSVVFGARVTELIAGVAEAREAIESLNPAVSAFTTGLSGIAEAVGAAFIVDKIRDFAEGLAEVALRTKIVSEALGTTPEVISRLSAEMGIATGDFDLPSRAMERLATNIVDGSKKAQRALADLGISTQDQKRMTTDLEFAVHRLSQAYTEGERGFARTADLAALVGQRFAEQMIPLLMQTSEQWKITTAEAERSGAIMSGPQLAAMEAVEHALNVLSANWRGLTNVMAEVFGPQLVKMIKDLTTLVDELKTVVSWLGWLGDQFNKVAADVENAGHAVNNFVRSLLGLEQKDFGEPEITKLPDVAVEAKAGTRHLAGPGGDKAGGKKASDDRMQQWRDELRTQLEDEEHFFSDSKAEELAFWQAKLALVKGGSDQDIKLRRELHTEIFNLERELARQTERDRLEEIGYQEKVNDILVERKRSQIEADFNLGKIGFQQEIELEKQLVEEKLRADEDYYHRKEAAAAGDVRTMKKLEEEEYLDHEKLVNQELALDDKLRQKQHEWAKSAAEGIGSSISSAAGDLMFGRASPGQAASRLGEQVIQKVMDNVIQKLIVQSITNLLEQLAADAANTGILATLLSLLIAKPSVLGTTFGAGGIVSAEQGWVIPHFQSGGIVAQVHQGEAVLPEHWTSGLDQMFRAGGPGGSTNINIHAIDTQSGAQFLMQHGEAIAHSWRNGGLYGHLSPREISYGGRWK